MKKLFILLASVLLLVFIGNVNAANLHWDAPATGTVVGYNVQYNGEAYNAGDVTTVENIDTTLGLQFGVEYTITVTAYNDAGESGPSNSVLYTREAYTPPENDIPIVISPPSTVTITIKVE